MSLVCLMNFQFLIASPSPTALLDFPHFFLFCVSYNDLFLCCLLSLFRCLYKHFSLSFLKWFHISLSWVLSVFVPYSLAIWLSPNYYLGQLVLCSCFVVFWYCDCALRFFSLFSAPPPRLFSSALWLHFFGEFSLSIGKLHCPFSSFSLWFLCVQSYEMPL